MISDGVWRYSEQFMEVTTSKPGILEGSKRVCDVANPLKPQKEVEENGKTIAMVPDMIRALRDANVYFKTRGKEVSRQQAIDKIEGVLNKLIF